MSCDVLTVAMIDEIVEKAGAMDPPVRPASGWAMWRSWGWRWCLDHRVWPWGKWYVFGRATSDGYWDPLPVRSRS